MSKSSACLVRGAKGQQPRSLVYKASLIPLQMMGVPVQHMAMDIAGALPRSRAGNWYNLVLWYYATCLPEEIPLHSIHAEHVAEELVFSRISIPDEIRVMQVSHVNQELWVYNLATPAHWKCATSLCHSTFCWSQGLKKSESFNTIML